MRYALPLLPYALCLTLLSQFDRCWSIAFMAVKLRGFTASVITRSALCNDFHSDFECSDSKVLWRYESRRSNAVKEDARIIFAVVLMCTVTIVLFGQQVATLILPEGYALGFSIIPFVALGALCFGIFQIWVRVLAYYHKTALISVIATLGVFVNVVLNLWLVPRLGWQVAAWTTVAAYLFLAAGCLVRLTLPIY